MNDPRPSPAVEAPKPIARKPSTVRRMVFMLIAAGVVFGGVFAVKAMMDKGMNDFFDNQSQPVAAVSAYVAKAERWRDDAEAVGTFVAVNGTDVTTEAGGVIREILFKPGQQVRAGTVLVRLNTTNEEATLRALEAAAKLAVAQRDRWRTLGAQKLVSQDEVEQRAADAAAKLAQVEAQRAVIALKTIRAPFDGVLGIRKINLGQFVNPGDPLVNLQSLNPILLDFTLPQQRMGDVQEGTAIRATLDSLSGQVFDGRITAIEPQVDAQTRNFTVQASFVNDDGALRPGVFAKVAFALGGERSVVVVPQTAVSFNPYGNAVYVIEEVERAEGEKDAEGKPLTGKKLVVRQRFVKTGATRGDLVAVTEGLKPGERVVTSGLLKLRNDAEITINNKVQPAAEAAPKPGNS
ncbi:efflux RND transporter periplasmic adaptor subunit [Lysobacter hankyongensis]|uniref:Efflux RND transporter periplasmic adaptor subunit n=1 Tax=Lysobacter hankyongensis TaxID=1176535 RepID=A0ABP9AXJ2_9GAMM